MIKFMGLWDTVSATTPKLSNENLLGKDRNTYIDQLCNIHKAAHAVSIDDNRAKRFSPELMTFSVLAKHCGFSEDLSSKEVGTFIKERVDEVWFSGSHSDVGGGYSSKKLSNISLNWMLRKIKDIDDSIFTVDVKNDFPEDVEESSHIGENAIVKGNFYFNWNRNIPFYMTLVHPDLSTFTIHASTLKRLKSVPRTLREFAWVPDDYSYTLNFYGCFDKVELPEGPLKNDTTKVDYTLNFNPSGCERCFYIDDKELYEY